MYKVIGIMSGTSLDGLDIAYCEFRKGKKWSFRIPHAKTVNYSKAWKHQLSSAFLVSNKKRSRLDERYGNFIGKEVLKFIRQHNISPDLISSHGHTVFHQPEKRYTLQIGSGKEIASVCNVPVVCDFRSGDVALGGQGAPLVPIADKLLFSKYSACLNLGGFANISYDDYKKRRVAFDICPVNLILNYLSEKLGKKFDDRGRIASTGKINEQLLDQLNAISFYSMKPPKSLGREWAENFFLPILDSYKISIKDKLRTVVEHIAVQIAGAVSHSSIGNRVSLLITGGGAYNRFLIQRISAHARVKISLPDNKTIQFKEAMAFAFLGVLNVRKEINCLKSVTGAKRDSTGGILFLPC
ncbi:MAG TPA: anhydro-N-acetylmuramic acid kinase [Bacteroidia bacterium]